ncbi:Predicted naringenin-chalcone synthase [Neorhodopirellula lusitana]|uniref:Predicted naringenin-chalcone synthase n=1 Tax=Neorhodopirellula lusitana TaxID=445327 RepID=A0ABY1Q2G3_9BACT|nr:type III polyketide synthase [Neorhodopirellula lusitana]SMP53187.1 Predicted naringenin-chalcone synthase [Neorhodopirellula lusitana]
MTAPKMPTATILAVASVVPELSADLGFTTAAAQAMSCDNEGQAAKVAKLYRRTGVQTRGSVLLEREVATDAVSQSFYPPLADGTCGPTTRERNERFALDAPQLAIQAGADALESSGCQASEVTHLITVTCTGFYAPGIDVDLIETLHLPATTQRVQVGFMGCHALVNALRTARGLVAADPNSCVLIVCIELCSLHYQYGYDAQRIVSGSLFADGAAGVVVVGSDGPNAVATDSETSTVAMIQATGSCLIPNSRDEMTWKIGDHGFEMTLSAAVPRLIEENLLAYMTEWLAQNGQTIESIGGWAVHPGGVRILQAVQTSLGLAEDQLAVSREVLREHGNMSSATLGAVLKRFQEADVPRPWIMLGFGPGLEIEVALLT